MNITYGKSVNDIMAFMDKYKIIYLYGAGIYAKSILDCIGELRKNITALVVTSKAGISEEKYGLPVMEFGEVCSDGNKTGFILALPDKYISDVVGKIQGGGYNNLLQVEDIMFLKGGVVSAERRPALEITAKLGCSVNCRYCPQSLLYNRYFADDKNRVSQMTYEEYKICIDKTPPDTIISFAGFVEPFLHKQGADMIRYAYESGRDVMLFTTLMGLTEEKWKQIADIPFYQVVLHTPDKKNFAHIPVTKEYAMLLDRILDHRKPDGSNFIDFANCQSEPSDDFLKIAKGRVRMQGSKMTDRAGALEGEGIRSASCPSGEIYCTRSYNMDNWVLLPDGTVVLCCMDYGLKHPLGNLLSDDYNIIKQGEEYRRIIEGLHADYADILCRQCTFAQQLTEYSPITHFLNTMKTS